MSETALADTQVGARVWFASEKRPYTVQARSDRYLVCTKPFNLRRTTLYTIIDLWEGVRGPENLIFGMGAETREQCEAMLNRLEGLNRAVGYATEVSHRHRIPLDLTKVQRSNAHA